MAEAVNKPLIETRVIETLKSIFDPEIPVDIYELGLIYSVVVSDTAEVEVEMTLTSPSCPVAETLPGEVEQKVKQTEGVSNATVNLVFEPTWTKDMMSEEARLELGFM
jgi:FeS assembly SUF system protein